MKQLQHMTVIEHEALEEAFNQRGGEAWVKANPNLVRTVLAAYPHRGKTLLITKEEFAGKILTLSVEKIGGMDFSA